VNVPERWLRSFCNPPVKADRLAHMLTMSGLEVESCRPVAAPFRGVVVGEILKIEPHPDAHKLTVCTVSAGAEQLTVVCGAPNVRVGMKAPLARVGAELGGTTLRAVALRGVSSHGMLCSARELGMSEDHSGLLELPASARPGHEVRKLLDLDEHVLTFKLTPNRADCLSMLGIAREVAAVTGAPLKLPSIKPVAARNKVKQPMRISHVAGCGRFAGRVIRNVDASAPTPTPRIMCDDETPCTPPLVCDEESGFCIDPSTPTPTATPLPTCMVDEDCECDPETPVEECDRCRAGVCVPPRDCELETSDLDCRGPRETCVEGFCECGGDCNINGLVFGTEISTMMCILGGVCEEDACVTADVNEDAVREHPPIEEKAGLR